MSEFYCTDCGRRRLTNRCGCLGTRSDAQRLLRQAGALRAAAEIHPPSAEANLADAERLEAMAGSR